MVSSQNSIATKRVKCGLVLSGGDGDPEGGLAEELQHPRKAVFTRRELLTACRGGGWRRHSK